MRRYFLIAAGAFSLFLCGCFGERADFSVLMNKAAKYAEGGQWSKALEYSRQALERQPGNVEALVLNALAYENCGQENNALDEIAKAAELAPNSFFVQYTRGRMLFERGRYESCIAPLKNAMKLRPDSVDTAVLLARVSTIQKNMNDARYYYTILAKSNAFSKNPVPWSELGMIILLDANDPKKSIAYFNYAYKLAPSDPATVLNMAVLCDKYLKRNKEAKGFYQKYLTLTQRDSSLSSERAAVEARIRSLD